MNKFPAEPPEIRPEQAQFVKEVFDYLGCKDQLTKKFIAAVFTAITVFDFKQQRYGVDNTASGGEAGVRIRLNDKAARLANLMKKGLEPEDETIEDSFGDSGVYGIIGLMCRWGWWPGVEAAKPSAATACTLQNQEAGF